MEDSVADKENLCNPPMPQSPSGVEGSTRKPSRKEMLDDWRKKKERYVELKLLKITK